MGEGTGRFLKISYKFFDSTEVDNLFKRIGTNGFCLYTYLLYKQQGGSCCEINLRMIQSFLNRDYKNRKTLKYGSKEHQVKLLKDKSTIIKYLEALKRNKLIKIIESDIPKSINKFITIKAMDINSITYDTNINENVDISSGEKDINSFNNLSSNSNSKNLFIPMSEELFVDYIYRIGGIGWSILCLLSKLFNKEYGSISCEGFANPSQEYMSNILKIDEDTISAYSKLLEEYKLIKICPQEPILKCIDYDGNNIYDYIPNNYVVKCKLEGNKYYVG